MEDIRDDMIYVRIPSAEKLLFVQLASNDCWDWTVCDLDSNELDGGQYDLDLGTGETALTAWDAATYIIENETGFDFEDIDIENESFEFLDPEEFYG